MVFLFWQIIRPFKQINQRRGVIHRLENPFYFRCSGRICVDRRVERSSNRRDSRYCAGHRRSTVKDRQTVIFCVHSTESDIWSPDFDSFVAVCGRFVASPPAFYGVGGCDSCGAFGAYTGGHADRHSECAISRSSRDRDTCRADGICYR